MADARPVIDCHNHVGVEMASYLRGDFPYAQSLPALNRQLTGSGLPPIVESTAEPPANPPASAAGGEEESEEDDGST